MKPPLLSDLLVLNAADNVGIVVGSDFRVTTSTNGTSVLVPFGHKIALKRICEGERIVKYGQGIAIATANIEPGEHVHEHNAALSEATPEYQYCVDARDVSLVPETSRKHFLGYRREDGRVGTRNYVIILSSVNCSATVARAIADRFSSPDALADFPNVDGVVALTYGGGCAFDSAGHVAAILRRTFAGYATNPNVGAVLLMGLGCETHQVSNISASTRRSHETLQLNTIQKAGGTRNAIEQGVDAVRYLLPKANATCRSRVPASFLTIGLQCGGSDGLSGISANPALGYAADLVVQQGGTVVLSETPEIYGAEQLLTRRAGTRSVANSLLEKIEWWKDYAARNEAQLNNNPSFGNKLGGLTTIVEKSLGAVAKSGTTTLQAVYDYAEAIDKHGFVFMDTPGYDPMSVTGQIAGGCNLIAFTTGRGSAAGYKPVPCIKLASNTQMYLHMSQDMDFNCGTILSGEHSIASAGRDIFRMMITVASGQKSCSETLGYGDNEFVPWTPGAVM